MPPSPGERIIRDGFVGGMGLGAGWIGGGGETYRGIAFAATAGFMVTPQIAALADFHLVAKQVTPYASLSHSAAVAAVQVFFADYFWVKAGLGGAWLSASAGSAYETTGARPALLFALGAEPLQTTAGFALDVQLRVMGARYQGPTGRLTASNVSLLLGANWY